MNKESYIRFLNKFKNDNIDTKEALDLLAQEKIIDGKDLDNVRGLLGDIVSETRLEPFRIFGDSEILTLCVFRPVTIRELEGLPGFPKDGARVTKYGERIVNLFSEGLNLNIFK